MEPMSPLLLCLLTLSAIYITHLVHRWRNPKCRGKLPPGSLGIPLLGESIPFFSPYTAYDMHPFIKKRIQRHGLIFKTSVVGQPFIVSADEELNNFIFQQEGRLFQSWWPTTFVKVFGDQNMAFKHGSVYKYLKSIIMGLVGAESLRDVLLPEVSHFARKALSDWVSEPSVDVKEATAAMIFGLTAKKLIGCEDGKTLDSLRQNFATFTEGLLSFPIDIPGTAHYRCMEGRRKAIRMLKEMIGERQKASSDKRRGDFLDRVVDEMKENCLMTEEVALDLMFLMLFASFETTSLALTAAIKCLTDHPQVLEKVTEEQEEILMKRKDPVAPISWTEYKSMTFTSQVINETLRLANIVPGIFRKALEDVEIKGYTIPAGWPVMVCPPAIHLNPSTYESPLSFEPSRWKGIDTTGGTKTFMAFGGGMRFCVGADFSKMQMTVFIHHLVSEYRWEAVKGGDIARTPGLLFPNGFHIRLQQKYN